MVSLFSKDFFTTLVVGVRACVFNYTCACEGVFICLYYCG